MHKSGHFNNVTEVIHKSLNFTTKDGTPHSIPFIQRNTLDYVKAVILYQLQQSSQQHDIRRQHFHFQAHPRYAASATQILAHPRFYQCIYI
jgi:hypothetical protein